MISKRNAIRVGLPALIVCLAAITTCNDGTGPEDLFPPLEFWAPIVAMFPGMQDTVIAARYGQVLTPEEGRWSSSDPQVVSVAAGWVVRAGELGEAVIRLELEGTVDSLRIAVVEPPAGQIVFIGFRERDPEARVGGPIWIMNADGTDQRLLYDTRVVGASNPHFSPDGCSIVFEHEHTVYVMDLERPDVVRRVAAGVTPVWSPDGQQIAFSWYDAMGFQILTVRPDGTDLNQRSNFTEEGGAIFSDFFPDSRSLAAALSQPVADPERDLYRFDLQSGELTPLVQRLGLDDRYPSVSPDGQSIAFSGPPSGGPPDLGFVHIVDLTDPDSSIRLLTPPSRVGRTLHYPDGTPSAAGIPAYSPDGEWVGLIWNRDNRIVRVEIDENGEMYMYSNTARSIYVVRADGSHFVRLTHMWSAYQPDWGPTCASYQQ